MRWVVALVVLAAAVPARAAEVERYALLIGNPVGWRADAPLQYAERDAARVHEVLRDLGGFAPENMLVLNGEDVDAVRGALIALNDRIRAHPGQSVLFVYYSGHADAQSLHLGTGALAVTELQRLVRGSAATFRLLVLDSCRSGAITRLKGGTPVAPFAIDVEPRLPGEGVVFLTSSSANEDAQESDELKGSFFTHFLVSGLLGAADGDGDGRVTLGEAYRYTHENTMRETSRTYAGTQHPTFRYDFKGEGDVVLTTLASARGGGRAAIRFPDGRDYLLFAGSEQGNVVAEINAQDRARRLSLRPGRYFVRARGTDHLLEGDLELAAGEDRVAAADGMRRVEYARLVRKGSGLSRTHGLEAAATVRTPVIAGRSLCPGLQFGYALDLRQVTIKGRLGVCRAGFENERIRADTMEFDASLRVGHTWDLGRFSFELGLSGGAALFHESFTTVGKAPDRLTAALEVGAGPALGLNLGRGWDATLEVAAQTFFFDTQDDAGDTSFASHFAALFSLGIVKRF